jgi:hypothetical protein
MYADVHRLLLQVAREYPEVRRIALDRLRSFIQDPAGRTRERTPSLGELMQCLLITEEITLKDLLPTLLPEALRRHVARQHAKEKKFNSRDHELSRHEKNLVAAWDNFAPKAGLVVSFCAMFYDAVGRPGDCPLEEVEAKYDQRWGRLGENVTRDLMKDCARLCQQGSVADLLIPLLPERSRGLGWLCEAILWAEKHGYRRMIPADGWPRLTGPHPLLRRWLDEGQQQGREQRSWPEEQREDVGEEHCWDDGGKIDGLHFCNVYEQMPIRYPTHDQPWLEPLQGQLDMSLYSAYQHWYWRQWFEYQHYQQSLQWWDQEATWAEEHGDTGLRFRVFDEPIIG